MLLGPFSQRAFNAVGLHSPAKSIDGRRTAKRILVVRFGERRALEQNWAGLATKKLSKQTDHFVPQVRDLESRLENHLTPERALVPGGVLIQHHNPSAQRHRRGLRAVVDAQLAQDAVHVVFNRAF